MAWFEFPTRDWSHNFTLLIKQCAFDDWLSKLLFLYASIFFKFNLSFFCSKNTVAFIVYLRLSKYFFPIFYYGFYDFITILLTFLLNLPQKKNWKEVCSVFQQILVWLKWEKDFCTAEILYSNVLCDLFINLEVF